MNWSDTAVEELKKCYIETDIPSDSLIKRKASLSEFTQKFNSTFTGGNFSEEEIASKLLRLRKSGKLPTLRT